MELKKENNQLILPESILSALGDAEYFDVAAYGGMIAVTPLPDGPRKKNGIASLRGKGKGKVWMSDDFDAPMEEFAEYM